MGGGTLEKGCNMHATPQKALEFRSFPPKLNNFPKASHTMDTYLGHSSGMLSSLAILLLSTAQQGQPALLSPSETTRRLEPTRILLKSHDWDTSFGDPKLPGAHRFSADEAAEAGYYYVQGNPDQMQELKDQVRSMGGHIFDYVPHNTFEAKLPAGVAASLEAYPFISDVLPVHPGFKLDPEISLGNVAGPDSMGRLKLMIEFWADADPIVAEEKLTELDVEITEFSNSGRYQRVTLMADPSLLTSLARIHEVKWIERGAEANYRNEKSKWVIQTNISNNTKLWDLGLSGANVYIGHIDGRIDEASCYFDDPDGDPVGPNHRKIKFWQGGFGTDSHGTHTAGSAAGDDRPNGGNGTYKGMAPDAFLVHHGSFPGSSQLLTYLNRAHTNGARIHTNSWGNDGTTSYNAWCRDIDAYSHDNEEGVVMFAVTNGSTLKNPENAKSCVAVGATSKSNQNNHGSGGRGPTADGRRKPEVYAPGCSTRSASTANCGTTTMCGTSMASPVVAGGAALVKQYFEDGYYPSGSANANHALVPSGSLLRAMLANSGVDMTGVTNYPSVTEGWGRILLDNSVFFTGDSRIMRMVDLRHANGISHGQTLQRKVNIPNGVTQLRLTLAFADEPGSSGSSQPVVNNLDLIAIAPDGTVYNGNKHDNTNGGQAKPNTGTADEKNTLEQIILYAPQSGRWTFQVKGTDVPVGPQGFAAVLTY